MTCFFSSMTQNVLVVRMIIIEIIATAVFVIVDVHQSLVLHTHAQVIKHKIPINFFEIEKKNYIYYSVCVCVCVCYMTASYGKSSKHVPPFSD